MCVCGRGHHEGRLLKENRGKGKIGGQNTAVARLCTAARHQTQVCLARWGKELGRLQHRLWGRRQETPAGEHRVSPDWCVVLKMFCCLAFLVKAGKLHGGVTRLATVMWS